MRRLIALLLLCSSVAMAGTYRNSFGLLVDTTTGAIVATTVPDGDTYINSRGFTVDAQGRLYISIDGGVLPDPGDDGACVVSSSGAWVRGACSGTPSTGTVTHTGGALTANSLMAGAGSDDAKVLASDPTNCSTGQAPTGIDKTGAAKGCFTPSGALPAGVSSDGANGLAVTGKISGASIETTGTTPVILLPDGGTAGANKLTSAATGILKWGTDVVSLSTHTHGPANVTTTVGTTAINANTCTSATTVTMTGLTTAMTFDFTPTSDTSAVTGWGSTGGLVVVAWPTADTLNYKVCNQTGSSITPGGSVTFNVSAR